MQEAQGIKTGFLWLAHGNVGRWEVEIKESCLAHESPHPVMTDEEGGRALGREMLSQEGKREVKGCNLGYFLLPASPSR